MPVLKIVKNFVFWYCFDLCHLVRVCFYVLFYFLSCYNFHFIICGVFYHLWAAHHFQALFVCWIYAVYIPNVDERLNDFLKFIILLIMFVNVKLDNNALMVAAFSYYCYPVNFKIWELWLCNANLSFNRYFIVLIKFM